MSGPEDNAGLKPCPFCGSVNGPKRWSSVKNNRGTKTVHWVYCGGCGARHGYRDTEAQSDGMWNRRASDWIACADRLPPMDHVVECAAKSGYDGSLYRVFAARVDADGEGWLWCDAGNRDLTDLSDFLDTDVIYWRDPTPLPTPPITNINRA